MKYSLFVLILFLIIGASFPLLAQDSTTQASQKPIKPYYQTAIGVKFYPAAVTVKWMMTRRSGLEFLGYFKDGFRLTGLYEWHGAINHAKTLKFVIGGGGHAGWGKGEDNSDVKAGVDGIIGLEYKFPHLPLSISGDYQPALGLGDDDTFTNWGGIGIRVTI